MKATQLYTRATACSQTATSMVLILLEVTVKATYWSTKVLHAAKQLLLCYLYKTLAIILMLYDTDIHGFIAMILILHV